ncbi:MAG: cation transporter [Candidatus Pacebacteria bacterium]|nr:cation transporter [Candidatus Paceibacterota bacterium]
MPYDTNDELPQDVQDALPEHGQEIYREAYNSASEQYEEEATAHQVAWSAVKNEYHQTDDGEWVEDGES